MLKRALLFSALIAFQGFPSFSQIKINEFLASNASVNSDPDYGSNADWVELYNAGTTSVDLTGYSLTDDSSVPDKWKIAESVSLPPKGYLVLWADGKDSGLHTNFKMSASGEFLGLYNPSLELVDSLSYGVQNIDISFGRTPDGSNTWSFFQTPTPGTGNGSDSSDNKHVPIHPIPESDC